MTTRRPNDCVKWSSTYHIWFKKKNKTVDNKLSKHLGLYLGLWSAQNAAACVVVVTVGRCASDMQKRRKIQHTLLFAVKLSLAAFS